MTQNTLELGDTGQQKKTGPVTCLGITFENEEVRRAYFTEELRKKLQDPEFRKIEGFPIGNDENILNLSDPPYYTACPNPWMADFIAEWEAQKLECQNYHYHREPLAADVSEGRSGLFYDAHSYHTKVPHKAIMRYILHYTEPGDIVFDGFCGTGMTGVAAQMCGDRDMVISLGYQVKPDGTILQEEVDENGKKVWIPFSKLGVRRAILNDLSIAAGFIAYNFNAPVDVSALEIAAKNIISNAEKEYGWLYETRHKPTGKKGKINYTIWSDVFTCPNCLSEIIFWESAVDHSLGKMREFIKCSSCGVSNSRSNLERFWVSEFSRDENTIIRKAKQVPVLINYTVEGKRHEKKPDLEDFDLINRINDMDVHEISGEKEIPDGFNTRQPKLSHGVRRIRDFYTKRNFYVLSVLRKNLPNDRIGKALDFIVNSYDLTHSTLMTRVIFKGGGKKPVLTGYQSGTLYISSLPVEKNIFQGILRQKLPIIIKSLRSVDKYQVVSTGSAAQTNLKDESLDYIFIDPPFGANIMYSELNFISEAWAKIFTNEKSEAIENSVRKKSLLDYRLLMTLCFKEAYRTLKKGRWITVEFSNTKASVWNSIQAALTEAGFIVANVSALDKKQGSFKAVTTPTAVKQDLVISAYKPNGGFEERFQNEAKTEEGVWDFVATHLKYLPITKRQGLSMFFVPERDPRILFDQMVAYFVQKGYPVPISSQEFQSGLAQRFSERNGMYFLPDQVVEYDRKKITSGEIKQMTMFVSDEASAIQWLQQLVKEKPQTFSDINPQFMQQLGGWSKNEAQLDLRELLNQNFLNYDGKGPVPEQIHAYLSSNWKELRNLPKDDPALVDKASDRWYVPDPNKAGDLEKLREKSLLKEFDEYKYRKGTFKRGEKFRLEAIRAGFKKAWQERDYALIVSVADKIPSNIIEEDPKLLMWYDQAVTRLAD
ncbi:DNA methyltransferase [Halomonas vilamensis]|uniref:DNA methyltransferase n=1 Tax=Vreelandella vilamensis TaxID=531309 RepID=A0ABU1H046_9GAMM|nr:DNA methyltransferase [Halomonas vilamensis]MDR5897679.1 DNA methyltransferase [Halomonas vilamensis]